MTTPWFNHVSPFLFDCGEATTTPASRQALRSALPTEVGRTTLGSAAAQSSPLEVEPARSRTGWWLGAAVVVIAGGASAAFLGLRGGAATASGSSSVPAALVKSAPIPLAASSPDKAEPQAPTAALAASNRVHLRVESDPPGATIVRAGDKKVLGLTPADIEVDRAAGTANFTLDLEGYRRAEITLPTDRDGSASAKLVVKGRASSQAPSRAQGPSRSNPGKHLGQGMYDPFK